MSKTRIADVPSLEDLDKIYGHIASRRSPTTDFASEVLSQGEIPELDEEEAKKIMKDLKPEMRERREEKYIAALNETEIEVNGTTSGYELESSEFRAFTSVTPTCVSITAYQAKNESIKPEDIQRTMEAYNLMNMDFDTFKQYFELSARNNPFKDSISSLVDTETELKDISPYGKEKLQEQLGKELENLNAESYEITGDPQEAVEIIENMKPEGQPNFQNIHASYN